MNARRDVAHLPMFFSLDFNNLTQGVEVNVPIQFSFPTRLATRMGSGVLYTTGPITPIAFVAGTDARDWCQVQFWYNGVQMIDTVTTRAQNILGTAQRPGMFGGFGWTLLGNTFLQIRFTPILANMYFTVTVGGIQIMPSMDSWGGTGREFDLIDDVNKYQMALDAALMAQQGHR
jgi:hypothetical protein